MKTTAYQLYMREIENIPSMTKKAEHAAFLLWKKRGRKDARMKIYTSNLRFVVSVAHAYKNKGQGDNILDLINEGNIAMDEAMDRFDHNKDVKFISYAVWYIRQAILQYLAEQGHFIKTTGAEITMQGHILKHANKLRQELGREPTNSEISKITGIKVKKIEKIINVLMEGAKSLSRPVIVNGIKGNTTLQDTIKDENVELPNTDNKTKIIINFLKKKLNTQQFNVVTSYYGINREQRNLEEISLDYDLTRERMRQIKDAAIEILKTFNSNSNTFNVLQDIM